jgi:hypothetical protein
MVVLSATDSAVNSADLFIASPADTVSIINGTLVIIFRKAAKNFACRCVATTS